MFGFYAIQGKRLPSIFLNYFFFNDCFNDLLISLTSFARILARTPDNGLLVKPNYLKLSACLDI